MTTLDSAVGLAESPGMLPSPRLIAAARVLAGLSRTELAAKAGIHVNALKRLEQGQTNPRASTIEAVVSVLSDHGIEFLGEAPDRLEGIVRRRVPHRE